MSASEKLGANDALRLAKAATLVIVSKGNRVDRFSTQAGTPNDEPLLERMLGPTGNLRAPTICYSKTVLVGFNEEVFTEIFLT